MKPKKKMSMYNKGGKTNPPKGKAPALSPTGRLLDDPRPQFEEEKNIPYFLRKDYLESGRKSAISADAPSPSEKARYKRSLNYDRLAENALTNAKEAFYKGEMSKEDVQKVKKAVEKYKADKPKFNKGGKTNPSKGGFNPQPDTSYQSPASKSARAKSKNKQKQIGESIADYLIGNNRAAQAQSEAFRAFREGDNKTVDEKVNETLRYGKRADKGKERLKELRKKPLSEFKEYSRYRANVFEGGGKMPEYMAGGKVYEDGGSLLAALMKDPKQRATAKKMLGM